MRALQWLVVTVVLSCSSALALRPQAPPTSPHVEVPDIVLSRVIIPWAVPRAAPPHHDVQEPSPWLTSFVVPSLPTPYAHVARQAASAEYASAIASAVATVNPEDERPDLADELYRICLRESRCGQYGHVGVHEIDSWTGARSYAWAVHWGKLSPETCDAHRLVDYAPVLRSLRRWEREQGRVHPVRARIETLPLGTRRARAFSTRGGWGMNAARGVRHLGECVGPEAMDDPRSAALVAARTIASCERADGSSCSCGDTTALWVGRGKWASRPLVFAGKSKASTVAVQCGRRYVPSFVASELLRAGLRVARAAVVW